MDTHTSQWSYRPSVKLTTVPWSLLKFPPSPEPRTLPPPSDHPSFAHPFTISPEWYNALLEPYVPVTIGLVYATTVTYFNSVNKRRNYKAWGFSKTRRFRLLVILHNLLLAVYSAWSFVGIANALSLSLPGWNNENGLAGIADSLCKLQGPRGLGNAATYDGLGPDRSDVGRLWNEGLAFYGWLFYISKFYEVIDTAIILAKGKKSSFLQTYHHAGAMLSMWAGIRYMSPPIWTFVFINSFIHAMMYTFYLCSALKISVPKPLKRSLTTMQIAQFVVGASYAFLHLFVAYQIPVNVPYLVQMAPKMVSVAAAEASSAASSIASTASADMGSLFRKLAFRAAGYEGLAANVGVRPATSADQIRTISDQHLSQAETRYKDELQWVHCLDTSGQAFGILLNVVYLLPLTWLFVRFFIRVYLTRLERRRSSTAAEQARIARESLNEATRDVARQVTEALEEMHRSADSSETESPIVESSESVATLKKKAADTAKNIKKSAANITPDVSKETIQGKASNAAQSARENAGSIADKAAEVEQAAQDALSSAAGAIKEKINAITEKSPEISKEAKSTATKASDTVQEKVSDVSGAAKAKADKKIPEIADQAKSTAASASDTVQEKASNASGAAKSQVDKKAGNSPAKTSSGSDASKSTADDKSDNLQQKASRETDASGSIAEDDTDDRSYVNVVKQGISGDDDRTENESKKSEADVKSESESQTSPVSPNEPAGTGVEEETGAKTETKKAERVKGDSAEEASAAQNAGEEEAKKEEEKIIDESQPVRDDDEQAENEAADEATQQSNEDRSNVDGSNRDGATSQIPRRKKNKKKA